MPACFGQVQPKNGQLDSFFIVFLCGLQWFAVVCGGLPASSLLWLHYLSSQILVVICGGLRLCVVVCGGVWWFAVVCLLVIPHSHSARTAGAGLAGSWNWHCGRAVQPSYKFSRSP